VRYALGFAPDAGMGPASGAGRLPLNTRNGRRAAQGPNLTPRSPRQRANSTAPVKYLPELGKTSYDGVTGKIEFDEKGDIKNGAITVFEIKDGKLATLKTEGGTASAK